MRDGHAGAEARARGGIARYEPIDLSPFVVLQTLR